MPFATVVGHAHLVTLLRQAVARGRVPHSLLFAGPEGIGKHAVALALAQAVNCPKRKDGDACGTCTTCQRIARGQHADVAFIDQGDEASIKIRVLRERVLDVIGYRPFEAARRVFVIDPADAVTPEAQNALLKTLEEPPPSAMIVLVSAYPDSLLPTIVSRCRRLRFAPLSEADVARVLTERAGVDRAKARALAAVSGGSVARALAEQAGDLDDDREAAMGLLEAAAAARGGVPARLGAAKALADHGSDRRDREALGARLAVVESLLRDLVALRSGSEARLTNADLESALKKLAPSFDVPRLLSGWTVIGRAQDALDRNASPKIVSDWVSLEL